MKTNPLKVFISMPFTGKSWESLTQERKDLHELAGKYDMEVVEQFMGYQGKEDFENKDYNPSFILAKDKNFIKESDVVIADFSSPSVGTDCEVTIAKELFDKKVYAVVPKEKRRHMWLIFYCDYFFDTVEEALKQIQKDFENKHQLTPIDKRQYDPIAIEYRLVEETPAQKFIYDPAVTSFIEQNGKEKNIIVLHAGSGYRARLAKKLGAGEVTGIDISFKQTQIAKGEELREPLGINYLVLDPYSRDFENSVPSGLFGSADIILGAFLLDHSMNRQELELVTHHIQKLLKPGGMFFGLSDHENAHIPTESKYGVVININGGIENKGDGTPRRISIFQNILGGDLEVLHFNNFLWTQNTVTSILDGAGFEDIEFHTPSPSEEGVNTYGNEFWQAYNEHPTTIAFSAKKK
jgi:2-polyprenyl-3-methyl-5-hydroxy-6-metoxy-1,4-benzoquinol methylase